jgi:hypothetical protein
MPVEEAKDKVVWPVTNKVPAVATVVEELAKVVSPVPNNVPKVPTVVEALFR